MGRKVVPATYEAENEGGWLPVPHFEFRIRRFSPPDRRAPRRKHARVLKLDLHSLVCRRRCLVCCVARGYRNNSNTHRDFCVAETTVSKTALRAGCYECSCSFLVDFSRLSFIARPATLSTTLPLSSWRHLFVQCSS